MNKYNISYNLDGGTYGTSHPTSAEYDTTVTISNPVKEGYIFTGWTITDYDESTSGHNSLTWTEETGTLFKNLTAMDKATVNFTATWKKASASLRTVGEEGIAGTNYSESTQIEKGSIVRIEAKLSKGYVFKGWYNGDTIISNDLSFDYTMLDDQDRHFAVVMSVS